MHLLNNLIVPLAFYEKEYNADEDTAIYELNIKNSLVDVGIKMISIDHCNINKNRTTLKLYIDGKCEYDNNLGERANIEALMIAQDFLIMNDLLLYVKGFGTPAFSNKVNDVQFKPIFTNGQSYYINRDR